MLYEQTMMKAGMVGNTTDCDESWDVMVMHCYGLIIAYLSPVEHCGFIMRQLKEKCANNKT
jgi:hypothetical protein